VTRLEENLTTSLERGRSDRGLLREQLRKTREMLADAGSGVDDLRQETSRLESVFELYGERQQGRMLAMRGLEETAPVLTEIPRSAKI
jgi:hypothetical protein